MILFLFVSNVERPQCRFRYGTHKRIVNTYNITNRHTRVVSFSRVNNNNNNWLDTLVVLLPLAYKEKERYGITSGLSNIFNLNVYIYIYIYIYFGLYIRKLTTSVGNT